MDARIRDDYEPASHGSRKAAPVVHRNLPAAQLVELALARGEGRLSDTGALVVTTGKYTGRSPRDKFITRTPETEDVIWWETNSQSQQLFADEEVVTGLILNGRAYDIVKEGAPIAIEWNQNIQSVDYLVVLKGSKNVDVAMHFINHMMGVEPQALVANLIAYAPTNPEAFDLIDPEVAPWLSTYPENLEKGFLINAEYWRDHLREVEERWTA
ncbi:MAG: extracellular solute-binding protein, partial [Symbiobacteriaceae bacterium]